MDTHRLAGIPPKKSSLFWPDLCENLRLAAELGLGYTFPAAATISGIVPAGHGGILPPQGCFTGEGSCAERMMPARLAP